ncbi:GNAT family N-acetyltransferase [Candidatus Thorarchaeota archaeon]|nr:MAG: GNAT family N-acetyltransferase [Candidatus Thorarchaeota archaeon]
MPLNRARNDPIWKQIRTALVPILGDGVEIFFPETWSEKYLSWYKEIEKSAFRPALTYSREEIGERLEKEAVLMMFILNDSVPEGLVLGYRLEESLDDIFYLDTIAVKQKGRGLGKNILKVLFDWAKKMGFSSIQLDTEQENETGVQLSNFYQKLGFDVLYTDEETGNITMQLKL